ncbi:MAG: FUSC family protein, partial [Hyphomicrobiales bacterium]|nr:FUSC family protein [Hyphomicrobiales bacterium]
LRDEAVDAATAAGLLRDIAALRPDMASLGAESASGSARSAAARSAAVALVAQVYVTRALNALLAAADPASRERMAAALDPSGDRSPASAAVGSAEVDPGAPSPVSAPLARASRELLRRDAEVREGLAALNAGVRPRRKWRTPLYRSQRIAAAAGIRAAACLALPSAFFVLAGWPAAEASLSLVVVVLGLGATTPDPKGFTTLAFIGAPIAALMAGALEFLILDGVNEFALLALALAPFMIGSTVLMTRPNRLLSGLGRVNLIFMLAIFAPSNPPSYNPQAWLFTSLFVWVATALLLAAQVLVPIESNERRQRWMLASARSDFERALSGRDRDLAPEEAMFRDATRIGQLQASGASGQDSTLLDEALSYFDRAAAIRLGRESVARLVGTSLSHLAVEAMGALAVEDTQRLRDVGLVLKDGASAGSALAQEISGELTLAAIVIDAARHATPPAMETVS